MRLDPIILKLKIMVDTKAKTQSKLIFTSSNFVKCEFEIHLYLKSLLGGHSELDPLLSIPNRTVKRFSADDSVVFSMRT